MRKSSCVPFLRVAALSVILLLTLPRQAAAHRCELWAWHKDGHSAALLCSEACRDCPGREEILILGRMAQGKPAIVWQAGDAAETPDPAAREQLLQRSAEWLRGLGFEVAKELPPFTGGHPAPQGAFPGPAWKTVTLVGPPEPTPARQDQDPAGRCEEGVPWPGSHAAIPLPEGASQQPGLLQITALGCARNENRENALAMRADFIPFGEAAAIWLGQLSWLWDTGHVSAEIEAAVSPQGRALLLRRTADSAGRSRELIFPLWLPGSSREPPPRAKDLYPGAYSGTFGENLIEYLTMPRVLAGAFLGSIGGGGDSYGWTSFHFSILEYLTFGEPREWLDLGVGGALFSYQRSSRGTGWSILGFGPALKVGRLLVEGRVEALSFKEGEWRPGLRARVVLPLATPREVGMWGIFIPSPMIGYDVWYRSDLSHDETHFWWGVTWLGNYF